LIFVPLKTIIVIISSGSTNIMLYIVSAVSVPAVNPVVVLASIASIPRYTNPVHGSSTSATSIPIMNEKIIP